jgi:hypothetical protein
MSAALEMMFAESHAATHRVAEKRDMANDEARTAIEALEQRVVDALGPDQLLRGLPNLGGKAPLYALRVHGSRRDEPFRRDEDGAERLVLNRTGRLLFATRIRTLERVDVRAPLPSELTADLLQPFAETVLEALRLHLANCEKRESGLDGIAELARKIRETIG